jgi:cytochrome c-type biogenesis protein CcmH/NrfF
MRSRAFTFWTRAAQALLLAVAVCFSMGATDAGSRADNLGHRLMCTCGCAQLLGECDHVGCPSRGEEMAMLNKSIATGETDKQIMDDFAVKYGATVLAAPKTEGFDLVAWIAPFAVFAAALLGTILLVKRWSAPETAKVAVNNNAAALERRDRIRRETEDGGF